MRIFVVRSGFHAEKTGGCRLSPVGLMHARTFVGGASLHSPAVHFDTRQRWRWFHTCRRARQRLIRVGPSLLIARCRKFLPDQNRQIIDLAT